MSNNEQAPPQQQSARRPYFLRPPVQEIAPPRGDVIRAAIVAAVLIGVLSYGAYTMIDWDFEEGTVKRQLDDSTKDLASAARTLGEYARRNKQPLPAGEGDVLGDEFVSFYAELQGNSALASERGRQIRGDVFAPGRSRAEPLRHVVEGSAWFLASRGPDRDWDISSDDALRAALAKETITDAARAMAYDPTNGAMSSGDLWVTSFGASSFESREERRP